MVGQYGWAAAWERLTGAALKGAQKGPWADYAARGIRSWGKASRWYGEPFVAAGESIIGGSLPSKKVAWQMLGRTAAALPVFLAEQKLWQAAMPPYGSMQSNKPINPVQY